MIVDVAALRQQAWRADKLYTDFIAYAKSVGCTLGEGACHDEIMADDNQAKLIAVWWRDHT
jgi:hypothetical protein